MRREELHKGNGNVLPSGIFKLQINRWQSEMEKYTLYVSLCWEAVLGKLQVTVQSTAFHKTGEERRGRRTDFS